MTLRRTAPNPQSLIPNSFQTSILLTANGELHFRK